MSTPVVSMQAVSKAYRTGFLMRRVPVLDRLELSVERGSVCGLLGPNGAGKSTTIRLLLGLLRPDSGRVLLNGHEPHLPRARVGVGFLPENPYLYDYLEARELLRFAARLAGLTGQRVETESERALERVGLAGIDRRPLRKYSKGMLQRLAMAQSLLGEPDVLVLDEPMSGLDPVGRRRFRDIILEQRDRGAAVLFSSHILQDAELICDQVVILVAGRVRTRGDLESMLARRIRHYELSVECERLEPGELPQGSRELARDGSRRLLRTADVEQAERVAQLVHARGGRVVSQVPVRDSLEDMFLGELDATPGSQAGSR